jgi:DNA-binding response OmpR family regulator/DNA-binding CsgD family transcriptional regulator
MSTVKLPDREVVLIVDDTPANLSLLTIALDQAGLVALVALDAYMALEQLKLIQPSVILLDLIMPGMDGFELCRRLQADPATRDIPVIFMTAMDDTEHMVQGFSDGAVDYVVKPVRPTEVVARIQSHLRRSRHSRQARAALESMERAAVALDAEGNVLWMTDQAQHLMTRNYPECESRCNHCGRLPAELAEWARVALAQGTEAVCGFGVTPNGVRLNATIKPDASLRGGILWISEEKEEKEERQAWAMDSVREQLGLTAREAEILMWVAYGKTNRQIGEILGISPRTVNKHLDHVYMKLGVETRAAATAIAIRNSQAA